MIVHSAAASDRSGAKLLIAKAVDICPTLKLFWADGGYSGKPLYDWVKVTFQRVLEIIKRPTGELKSFNGVGLLKEHSAGSIDTEGSVKIMRLSRKIVKHG